MTKTKEELQKIIEIAKLELAEIEDAENLKKNKKLLGRCFKMRNCYSCPKDESDYWWMFYKVVDVDERDIYVFSFQIDSNGKFEAEPHYYFYNPLNRGDEEISEEEFLSEWEKFRYKLFVKRFEEIHGNS